MTINYKIIVTGLIISLSGLIASPVFAQSTSAKEKPTSALSRRVNKDCFNTAQQTRVDAVHQANQTFKTEREVARDALKTALKSASDKAARKAAQKTYKDALTAAREKAKLAKRDANTIYKEAKQGCRQ